MHVHKMLEAILYILTLYYVGYVLVKCMTKILERKQLLATGNQDILLLKKSS